MPKMPPDSLGPDVGLLAPGDCLQCSRCLPKQFSQDERLVCSQLVECVDVSVGRQDQPTFEARVEVVRNAPATSPNETLTERCTRTRLFAGVAIAGHRMSLADARPRTLCAQPGWETRSMARDVAIKWTTVTLDCADAEALASFYSNLLGWETTAREGSGWVQARDPAGGVGLNFQSDVAYERPIWPEEPDKQAKMMHFEILVDDLEAVVQTGAPPRRCPGRSSTT